LYERYNKDIDMIGLNKREMVSMVEHLIEEAQKMGFGTFLFNDCKDEGFVFDIDNLKMYSVGDFVDYVMKERHRTYTMLER
tara:strand:- start:2034 stop:2276 length:243 start_codon:yes stop_codon:yes gene_type:complete